MVAFTNEVFLKVYFSMAIDVPEFQSEVEKFLKDPSSSYSHALESIHLDYIAQTTGEEMRSKTGTPAITSSLHRGKVDFDVPKRKMDYFPPNMRRILPTTYYS